MPEGSRVAVYQAPLDALPPQRSTPKGCRRLDTQPSMTMTELDMEGQKDLESDQCDVDALHTLTTMPPAIDRNVWIDGPR